MKRLPWPWARGAKAAAAASTTESNAAYHAGDLSRELRWVIRTFAVLLVCYLGTMVWGAYLSQQFFQAEKITTQVYQLQERVSELKAELNSNFLYIPDSMQNYYKGIGGHPAEDDARAIVAVLRQDAQVQNDPRKRQMVDGIAASFAAYHKAFLAIMKGQQNEGQRDAAASLGTPSLGVMEHVGEASSALLEIDQSLQQLYEANEGQRSQKVHWMYTGIITGSLFLSLTFLGLGFFLSRTRRKANEALVSAIVASREAEAENENINNSAIMLLQAVSQMADRNLTARAPVTQDVIGTVSDSVNGLAEETQKVLQGVVQVAGQVRQAAMEVRGQARLVEHMAASERTRVEGMAATLEQAAQAMVGVANMAQTSNAAANQATQATHNALDTVDATVQGMHAIRATIAETEKRIKRLGERSQEISGVVNLINNIAERTHVLALNAVMQAAVAGEAGRGFGVVAEEVQRLADSSRQATQQIGALVGNIQIETNEAISTVGRTIEQVVQGSEHAQKAGEQMRRTQSMTAELVTQVRHIASAAEAQKALSGRLLESVHQIGESVEQTAEQIQQQNTQTEGLQEAARELFDSVGVFKLQASDQADA